MTDLSWLDNLEGLEETGSQTEQIESFKRFRGLEVWNLNGRTGEYSKGKGNEEVKTKNLFGSILAYSEVRTLFVGLSTPPAWEIELAKHTLPDSTPLCTWEGGTHRPRINDNIEIRHQQVLANYGAGSACRGCTLGQWQRHDGKPIKPACPAKAAILFLPLVGPDFKTFAEEPVIIQVNNYRSVDKVLGKWSKTEPVPSLQEVGDQYGVGEYKRMIPVLALRAKFFSTPFSTQNGEFFHLDYSFHQVFEQPQVAQALAVFKAHNVFRADELPALPAAQPNGAALPAASGDVKEAEFSMAGAGFPPADPNLGIDDIPF